MIKISFRCGVIATIVGEHEVQIHDGSATVSGGGKQLEGYEDWR